MLLILLANILVLAISNVEKQFFKKREKNNFFDFEILKPVIIFYLGTSSVYSKIGINTLKLL